MFHFVFFEWLITGELFFADSKGSKTSKSKKKNRRKKEQKKSSLLTEASKTKKVTSFLVFFVS